MPQVGAEATDGSGAGEHVASPAPHAASPSDSNGGRAGPLRGAPQESPSPHLQDLIHTRSLGPCRTTRRTRSGRSHRPCASSPGGLNRIYPLAQRVT